MKHRGKNTGKIKKRASSEMVNLDWPCVCVWQMVIRFYPYKLHKLYVPHRKENWKLKKKMYVTEIDNKQKTKLKLLHFYQQQ